VAWGQAPRRLTAELADLSPTVTPSATERILLVACSPNGVTADAAPSRASCRRRALSRVPVDDRGAGPRDGSDHHGLDLHVLKTNDPIDPLAAEHPGLAAVKPSSARNRTVSSRSSTTRPMWTKLVTPRRRRSIEVKRRARDHRAAGSRGYRPRADPWCARTLSGRTRRCVDELGIRPVSTAAAWGADAVSPIFQGFGAGRRRRRQLRRATRTPAPRAACSQSACSGVMLTTSRRAARQGFPSLLRPPCRRCRWMPPVVVVLQRRCLDFTLAVPPRNKGRRYPADPPTIEEIGSHVDHDWGARGSRSRLQDHPAERSRPLTRRAHQMP
jgi:hypothetical protein